MKHIPARELEEGDVIKTKFGRAKVVEVVIDMDTYDKKAGKFTQVFLKVEYMDGKYRGIVRTRTVAIDQLICWLRLA